MKYKIRELVDAHNTLLDLLISIQVRKRILHKADINTDDWAKVEKALFAVCAEVKNIRNNK